MKSIGKIGVFIFFQTFLFPGIVFFIQFLIDSLIFGLSDPFRLTALGAIIMLMGPYFFTYSKWANDNIWNTKTSKPTNESTNPINPNDDNQKVLDNIQNVLNTSKDNSALQKIEELKRQIAILEQAIKNNNSNSETESPELSKQELTEEKIDYGEWWKRKGESKIRTYKEQMKDFEAEESDSNLGVWAAVLVLLIICFIMIIANN